MPVGELIRLYFERSAAMQTFWNFEISVVLAVVALFGSGKLASEHRKLTAALVTIAYVAFATVNLNALTDVTTQRLQVKQAIITIADSDPNLKGLVNSISENAPRPHQVVILHLFADAFAVASMWIFAIRKQGDPVAAGLHAQHAAGS